MAGREGRGARRPGLSGKGRSRLPGPTAAATPALAFVRSAAIARPPARQRHIPPAPRTGGGSWCHPAPRTGSGSWYHPTPRTGGGSWCHPAPRTARAADRPPELGRTGGGTGSGTQRAHGATGVDTERTGSGSSYSSTFCCAVRSASSSRSTPTTCSAPSMAAPMDSIACAGGEGGGGRRGGLGQDARRRWRPPAELVLRAASASPPSPTPQPCSPERPCSPAAASLHPPAAPHRAAAQVDHRLPIKLVVAVGHLLGTRARRRCKQGLQKHARQAAAPVGRPGRQAAGCRRGASPAPAQPAPCTAGARPGEAPWGTAPAPPWAPQSAQCPAGVQCSTRAGGVESAGGRRRQRRTCEHTCERCRPVGGCHLHQAL